jgi:sugar transferase (PEP-CTERM system associated)
MIISRHSVMPGARASLMVDLALGFAAMMLAASTLRSRFSQISGTVPELPLVLFGAAVFATTMAMMYAVVGLYRPKPISLVASAVRTLVALAVGGYITALAMRLVGDRGYIEQLVPGAVAYLVIGLLLEHMAMRLMRQVAPLPRVLVVGTGAEAQAVSADLRRPGKTERHLIGFFPTGVSPTGETEPGALDGERVFGTDESLLDLVQRHGIQEIIVAVKEQRGGGVPMDELLQCRIRGIPVLDMAAYSERTKGEVPIDSLKGSFLVYGDGFVQGAMRRAVKRGFDIACSSLLIALTLPLMLLTMLVIRLDSPGPLIYRQERVGLGGRSFWCVKFRSMRADAERDGVARWAQKGDSRITRVGHFIRKTRIDELPQLFSVLKGEMSLVGPRPERPTFVEKLKTDIPFYELRHSVKPGITGWAQVRHHYAGSLDDARRKTQFDLFYVKNNSLFLDVVVLIETVSVVLFREGQ